MEEIAQTKQQTQEHEGGDERIQEETQPIQVVDEEETHTQHAMWLEDKVNSIQKGKEAMEVVLRETQAKLGLLEGFIKDMVQRSGLMEGAITQIVEHIQSQNLFNECVRTTLSGLVEEVKTHQGHFQEVARVLQNHETNIAKTGVVSQGMVQYINALVEEIEEKRLWIGSLISAFQEQSQVLRQH